MRKRAAYLEAIAIGPGGRPYTISVSTVALVNGKDEDLERFKAEKADILTWPSGLGQAKVIAYYLEDPNIVTIEAHVRRGDKIIAIAAVGPQTRVSGRLLKEALPTLRLL